MFAAFGLGFMALGFEPRGHAGSALSQYGTRMALDFYHPMGRRCSGAAGVAGHRQIKSPRGGFGHQRVFDRFCGVARLEDVVFRTQALGSIGYRPPQPHGQPASICQRHALRTCLGGVNLGLPDRAHVPLTFAPQGIAVPPDFRWLGGGLL